MEVGRCKTTDGDGCLTHKGPESRNLGLHFVDSSRQRRDTEHALTASGCIPQETGIFICDSDQDGRDYCARFIEHGAGDVADGGLSEEEDRDDEDQESEFHEYQDTRKEHKEYKGTPGFGE